MSEHHENEQAANPDFSIEGDGANAETPAGTVDDGAAVSGDGEVGAADADAGHDDGAGEDEEEEDEEEEEEDD